MRPFFKVITLLAILMSFQSCIVCYIEPEQPREYNENTNDAENSETVE